jgi:hypothetical protein
MKNKSINKKQPGFITLESLLMAVIFLLVLGIGYYVWHANRQTNKLYTAATNTSSETANLKKEKLTPKPAAGQQYLIIKEWGVKLPLSNGILNAYYSVSSPQNPLDQMNLSLDTLKQTQCKAEASPPSVIFRYTDKDMDPVSGNFMAQMYGTAHKIDKYYYYVANANGVKEGYGCKSTAENQTLANTAAVVFKKALDGISQ